MGLAITIPAECSYACGLGAPSMGPLRGLKCLAVMLSDSTERGRGGRVRGGGEGESEREGGREGGREGESERGGG